jgi:hypothetical protein
MDFSNVVLTGNVKVTVREVSDEVSGVEKAGPAVSIVFSDDTAIDTSKGVILTLPYYEDADPQKIGIFHLEGDDWMYQWSLQRGR